MSRPRVFLPIQTNRFDVSPVEVYGEHHFLLKTENFSPFQSEMIFRIFRAELAQQNFDASRDFIALTGPTNFVVLLAAFVLWTYGKAKVLMFDARVNQYVERTLPDATSAFERARA